VTLAVDYCSWCLFTEVATTKIPLAPANKIPVKRTCSTTILTKNSWLTLCISWHQLASFSISWQAIQNAYLIISTIRVLVASLCRNILFADWFLESALMILMIVLPDSVGCGRLPLHLCFLLDMGVRHSTRLLQHTSWYPITVVIHALFEFLLLDSGINQLVELLCKLPIWLDRRKMLSTISRGSRCSPFPYAGVSGVAPPIEPLAAARSLHPVRQDFMYPHTLLYQLSSGNCDAFM
jgi:hypothetical protein